MLRHYLDWSEAADRRRARHLAAVPSRHTHTEAGAALRELLGDWWEDGS